MKIYSFFGHRNVVTEELTTKLKDKIICLLTKGYDHFYFGGFGDFDNLCWQIITEFKFTSPNIKRKKRLFQSCREQIDLEL